MDYSSCASFFASVKQLFRKYICCCFPKEREPANRNPSSGFGHYISEEDLRVRQYPVSDKYEGLLAATLAELLKAREDLDSSHQPKPGPSNITRMARTRVDHHPFESIPSTSSGALELAEVQPGKMIMNKGGKIKTPVYEHEIPYLCPKENDTVGNHGVDNYKRLEVPKPVKTRRSNRNEFNF